MKIRKKDGGINLDCGRQAATKDKEKKTAILVAVFLIVRNRSDETRDGYFLAAAVFAAASAYFFVKRSTRPAVSRSFCLPVKKGWQLEQISTRSISPLIVERVGKVFPQAQCTVTA